MAIEAGRKEAAEVSGWIAISRGIHEHPLFKNRPDRLYAWTWILANAAWQDTRQNVCGEIVPVLRGEICASQKMLCEGTGMSRQALRTFLDALEMEGAIKTRPATKLTKSRTKLTVCNYDKYQTPQPSSNQAATKQQPIKRTREQYSVSKDTGEASPVDPVKVMFDAGKNLLMAEGKSAAAAGSLLGKWRRDHGVEAVIAAIGRAKREGAINSVEFIEGCFRTKARKSEVPEIGERREFPGGRIKVWSGAIDRWVEVVE